MRMKFVRYGVGATRAGAIALACAGMLTAGLAPAAASVKPAPAHSPIAGPIGGWFPYSHRCEVIGHDQYGNKGIVCGDLLIGMVIDVDTWLEGQNEAFCQNSANVIVECAGIHETAALCESGGICPWTNPGVCGVRFGHSPCGARRVINDAPGQPFPTDCHPDIWGDALNTSIVLPQSGLTVGGLGTNEASDHYHADSFGC